MTYPPPPMSLMLSARPTDVRSLFYELLSRKMSIYLFALYYMCIRLLLEYNTVIWSPHTARDIDAIECVQRRFTKCLRGYNRYTYSERLSRLKLQSLELRRLVTDLLWCYKIVFNVVDISAEEFFCHVVTLVDIHSNYLRNDLFQALWQFFSVIALLMFGTPCLLQM